MVHFVSTGEMDYIDLTFFDDTAKYPGIIAVSKGIEADSVVKDYLDHIDKVAEAETKQSA